MRYQTKIAALVLVLATVGLAVSAHIDVVHQRLVAETGYVSWCNVNATINCDAVLTSRYAELFGQPMSRWAMLFYASVMGGSLAFMSIADRQRRVLLAKLLFVAQIWGLMLAAYLAGVALVVLRAVCLLCSSLYVVSLALLPAAWWLLSATVSGSTGWTGAWRDRLVRVGVGVVVVALVVVGVVQRHAAAPVAAGGDAATVCAADPAFCDWFKAQPRLQLPAGRGHSRGPENAPITIEEFSDFACGHCLGFRDALEAVRAQNGNDVRVVFHHFPLDASCNSAVDSSLHPDACLAAVAAECAGEQGQFWAYHDLLFGNQKQLGRAFLLAYAERLGLDMPRFTACLAADAPRARVAADTHLGMELGVHSTPTVFLNGRRVAGALDAGGLANALVLARSGL